jgi:hypothetical protein
MNERNCNKRRLSLVASHRQLCYNNEHIKTSVSLAEAVTKALLKMAKTYET